MYTILGVIAKPLGMLLNLLYGFVQNYGLTIIIFTLIVKLCLYPLYIKQTKSTARMAEVQPKMQALQNKYANDKETLNIKMAELYKEEKFNPMGGCLPMLIQMPIIMGLFALLRNPMQYITDDSMIFAFHESFSLSLIDANASSDANPKGNGVDFHTLSKAGKLLAAALIYFSS